MIDKNPTIGVTLPKLPRKKVFALNEDEIERLLYVIESGEGLTKRQQAIHPTVKYVLQGEHRYMSKPVILRRSRKFSGMKVLLHHRIITLNQVKTENEYLECPCSHQNKKIKSVTH